MTIWAHALVKNEERFLWFSVLSVIDHVDKILLWDMGSTDKTREIIKLLKTKYPEKVETKFLESVSPSEFSKARQSMLDATRADWFLVLDGDEIWFEDSIKKIAKVIKKKGNKIESIVVPTINLVGDIYHYQEEKAGRYNLTGRKGHYNLRLLSRNIPGLHAEGEHGVFGWVDDKGVRIEKRKSGIVFVDAPIMHASFLPRAGSILHESDVVKRKKKRKHEIGENFPLDYYYPETFFKNRPKMIRSPWNVMSKKYVFRAFFETPVKKIRRRTVLGFSKHGY